MPGMRQRVAPEATALTYVEIVLVALIWGTGSVAIKIADEGFPAMTAAGLRLALAACVYAPLLALNRRSVRLPRLSDLPLLVWLALTGYAVFNVIYFAALTRTTASHAVLVWGAPPVVTAVLAALLIGERVSRQAVLGVLVSMGGVALIVASSLNATTAHGADTLGDVMLLGMMILWVLYTVSSRVAMRSFSPLTSSGYACL